MRDRYASLREGLVGAWIPSVSGSGLLLPDLSGNGNNGTLTNMGPEDWVSWQYGRALDFDGSNDYFTAGKTLQSTNLHAKDFSVCFWAYETTTGNNNTIISSASAGSGWFVRLNDSAATLSTGISVYHSTTLAQWTTQANAFALNKWFNVVWIWSSDTKTATAFVDGVKQTSYSEAIAGAGIATSEVRDSYEVGRLSALNGQYLTGQLDDIRIYNRALSESEIKLLASRPGIGLRPQRRSMYYAPPTGARRRRILTSMP